MCVCVCMRAYRVYIIKFNALYTQRDIRVKYYYIWRTHNIYQGRSPNVVNDIFEGVKKKVMMNCARKIYNNYIYAISRVNCPCQYFRIVAKKNIILYSIYNIPIRIIRFTRG